MGETRVDLHHLLEDLRDAYPFALEETILTEIIANSLDSGALRIELRADAASATLTVIDDGRGMVRRELARYHDLAATTKKKGHGIGFAGVGIKLGLLACTEVVTETRRGKSHVASAWQLASRHRAPWRWMPPVGLVGEHGTAVTLRFENALTELLDSGYVEAAIARHFQPLLDHAFDDILAAQYPRGVTFMVNGRAVPRRAEMAERALLAIRMGRKRKPVAVGYLVRSAEPLAEDERGVAVSTLGKIIKRGWDWLGVTPAEPDRVGGLVEVPALAECLTLSKADFIRTGTRGATYLAYRKAVQEAVTTQLAQWGDAPDLTQARRPRTRPIERDLENVLVDLADDFPLLSALVERRLGGQRRLPFGAPGARGDEWSAVPSLISQTETAEEPGAGAPPVAVPPPGEPSGEEPSARGAAEAPSPTVNLPGSRTRSRPARLGLSIRFERRPDDPQLGRLVESTVWVNEEHPAYRRAVRSRSEGYHIAVTVALALAPLAVEPTHAHAFVTSFLECWGAAAANGGAGRRSTRRN